MKKILSFLFVAIILSSCSSPFDLKRDESEDEAYERIQRLNRDERFIAAAMLSTSFVEKFPESKYNEELEILMADNYFDRGINSRQEESVIKKYENFIRKYPNSSHVPHAKDRISKAEKHLTTFHKHTDLNVYFGPQLFSSGSLNSATHAQGMMAHWSVSYFFRPQSGVYLSQQLHGFNAKNVFADSVLDKRGNNANLMFLGGGYTHRWKLHQKWNLVYGLGAGATRVRFGTKADKFTNTATNLGYQQYLTLDFCAETSKRELCYNGIFPSIGLFHLYSPRSEFKNTDLSGHAIGFGVGFKL